jgi:Outer membrane protein beta-barrel domain
MKKIILSVAIIAATFGANAQVGYGAKLGLNIANLTGEDVEGVKSKIGFNLGGFVNIPVATSIALQPELLFSTEGAKIDGGGSINLNYVNVPVMLQYKSSGFYGELGPQIGLLVSAKAKEDGDSEDIKEFFKSSSFALNFGAGYQLPSGIGFGARYSLGLSNIVKDDDSKTKTSVLSIGIHYNFGAKAASDK